MPLTLLWNTILRLDRREPELALQRLDAYQALVAEQQLAFVLEPSFLRGAVLSAQGAFDDAVVCWRAGLASRLSRINKSWSWKGGVVLTSLVIAAVIRRHIVTPLSRMSCAAKMSFLGITSQKLDDCCR